jgi:cytochrome c oxidase subunit 4
VSGAAPARAAGALWRRNLIIWAALLALLGLTFGAAYLPMGPFNTAVGLAIAAMKAGLVAVLFMNLRGSDALIRLAAGAGFFWIVVMFALTMTDILARYTSG